MKAIVFSEYGGPDVLKPGEVAKPVPKRNEVLIKIHAVSVNYGDILVRNLKFIPPDKFNMPALFLVLARLTFGIGKPKKKILGNAFAGEVAATGNDAKKFKTGEQVFGHTAEKMGALAEYLCMPENGILAAKPENISFEAASAIPYGAVTALSLLKKVKIGNGQKVLVVGAAGSIGAAAVQLAKHLFGAEVTGVCGAASFEFVRNIGADKVIDYKKEDFTKNGEAYDLIFDILGKGSFSKYKASLSENGVYFSVSFKLKKLLQMLWTSIIGGKRVVCSLENQTQKGLYFIKELVEAGKFKSIIDKTFPFEQAAEAHRYFESGSKKGNVVIKINGQ